MSDTPPRPRFDRQALAVLQQGAAAAMGEVPELVAVGIVCVWDFPDQAALPAGTLVMPDGRPPGADTLLRMQLAAGRFQLSVHEGAMQGVAALHAKAAGLARLIHAEDQAGTRQVEAEEGPSEAGQPAPDPLVDAS